MDERQLGYPAREQSVILYPCPGTSALKCERTFSLRASSPRGTGEGRVQSAPENLHAGLRVLTTENIKSYL